jgi:integrase
MAGTVRRRVWTSGGKERISWQATYRDQQGVRRARQFPTRKAAADFLSQATYEVRQGTHTVASQSITVAAAIEQWLAHCEAEQLERGTIHTYRSAVEHHILPYLGTVKLAQLTRPAVEQFRDDLLTGNLPGRRARSRTIAQKALTCLKAALKDAQRRGQVAQNVASGVGVKTGGRHKRKVEIGVDVPTSEEVRQILAAAPDRWRPLIITAVFTGMRASELRGLTWARVDLDKRVIKVRQRADRWGAMGSPKSAAGNRDIPIGPMVVNTLSDWRQACPAGERDLVFPLDSGEVCDHDTMARHAFGAAQLLAGVVDERGRAKYGAHAFRHWCASWLIDRGTAPKRIQVLMGHSSITMTFDVYGHLFPTAKDEHEQLAAAELQVVGAAEPEAEPEPAKANLKLVGGG